VTDSPGDLEERIARIETLRAERAKFDAEAKKCDMDRRPWRLPTTWLVMVGAVAGLGSAAFQWQLSRLTAERSSVQVEKGQLDLDKIRFDLDKTAGALDATRAALLEASNDLQVARRTFAAVADNYDPSDPDSPQSKAVLVDLKNAESHALRAAENARDVAAAPVGLDAFFDPSSLFDRLESAALDGVVWMSNGAYGGRTVRMRDGTLVGRVESVVEQEGMLWIVVLIDDSLGMGAGSVRIPLDGRAVRSGGLEDDTLVVTWDRDKLQKAWTR
jgi:hypothetical protein